MFSRRVRSGFTTLELVLIVAVILLAAAMIYLFVKVNKVDDRGRALTTWIGQTDGAMPNWTSGGLTSYLIDMRTKLHDHVELKEPGNTVAHNGAPDNHLDPPPPPVW